MGVNELQSLRLCSGSDKDKQERLVKGDKESQILEVNSEGMLF